MKKLSYLIMIALMVYSLQGCNNAGKGQRQNADSLHKKGNPFTRVPDTGRKVIKPAVLKVDSADAKFAVNASAGNLYETALSVIALQITKNSNVKLLADTLITDHGKINDQLTAIAKIKNITLPAFISDDVQKNNENLAKKSGKNFDKAYLNILAANHKKALKLYDYAAKNCADADLKAFAAKTVPIIQMHLDEITKIQAGSI